MARTKRTNKELQEASNHLQYEFSMLISVAQALASGIATQGWLVNALLESFVIHFRALLDFFYPQEKTKKDDVLAEDYFDHSDRWKNIRPHLSEALSRAKTRAHKEIAHLTYARLDVTPETKGWAFIEIANEMNDLMEVFLKNVPRNNLGSRWKKHESEVA
jgi:hypothetical protein